MIVQKRRWQFAVSGLLLFAAATCLRAEEIAWQHDVGRARQVARQEGKPLLVHFWSESCGPCKKLDRYVFPHPDVARAVNGVVPVKVNTRQQRQVAQQFGVKRIPTDVLIAPDGRELWRGISPSTVNAYIGMVNRAVHLQQTAPDTTGLSQLADVARRGNPQARQSGFVGQTGYAPNRGSERPIDDNSRSGNRPPANPYASSPPEGKLEGRPPDERASSGGPFQHGGGSFQPRGGSFKPGGEHRAQQAASPEAGRPPSKSPNPDTNAAARNPSSERAGPSANPHYKPGQHRPPTEPKSPPQHAARRQMQPAAAKPKFALEGYCPVTLLQEHRWAKGDPRWGVVHRGQTYVFASEAKAKKFWADPDAYSPTLSGFDPVKFAEHRKWVEGRRQFGVFYKDQRSGKTAIVLFADEEALQRFWQNPEAYSGRVQQALQHHGQVQRR